MAAALALGTLAAGCGGQESEPDAGSAKVEPALENPRDEDELSFEPRDGEWESHDAEMAHRARKFYLQGVKLLYNQREIDQAIREFHLALEADPLFFKAHFKLGICYYHKGQYDLEIAEYRKCLAISGLYTPALLNLGHAHLARDELEEARAAYEKVLELEPENAVALYNLGLIEFDLGRLESSYEYLAKFRNVHHDAEDMDRRAEQYLDAIRRRLESAEDTPR